FAHEVVEMHPALAHQRYAQVEAVHEEALAAPDRAPEVHAPGRRRLDQQALERVAAPRLVLGPFLIQPLQALHRAPLGSIGDEAALGEALLVERDDVAHAIGVATRDSRRASHSVLARITTPPTRVQPPG